MWAENTDKKRGDKAKASWFLALIVAPSASDTAKIRTKKEFLIRSFKDGRYYTVSKKDTQRFRHNESPVKKNQESTMKECKEGNYVAFSDYRIPLNSFTSFINFLLLIVSPLVNPFINYFPPLNSFLF